MNSPLTPGERPLRIGSGGPLNVESSPPDGEQVDSPGNRKPDLSSIDRLIDSGLVMLINQAVLWPRGLALRVWRDDTSHKAYAMDVWEPGEYIAGWVDTPEDDSRLIARVRLLRTSELDREATFTNRVET